MRILLTGAAGQVGGALRPLLQGRYEVIVPSREQFDLSAPEAITGKLDEFEPDLIVNPAAYTSVDKAENEAALAFLVNGEAPSVMAAWAAGHGVPMVHFSTDYVFDGKSRDLWREDDPTAPLSVYGASKLAGEIAVRSAGGPHLIIRTAWVYAAQGANFMRTMIRIAKERDTLRVVADQFGAPTTAATIASAFTQILEQADSDLSGSFARAKGVLHLTNSGSASWFDFARAIIAGAQSRGVKLKATEVIPIATSDYPTRAARPANSQLHLQRLKEVYGIKTAVWQDALDDELDAYVVQGQRTLHEPL
ncbi:MULTISPECIES: dTDP-4-dehydrorhamnose reductase [Bradyrhizobium]|uniref:dTDP-4-dehydrorhamnose reductase n=1 Tax=Bradyrhizobium TaxID=374 RepID=UPI000486D1FE|nr:MULTISPECIES: dTDP-4-dehydrorhamnose reductase [Bradyrhizobium]WLB87442.1 dTDP-4-dehydrorhamnose reductase [Bradyrhizobium japonicum USDA 135]GLR93706.1 NAD(P)-dependent oxidoreductase [Bradyrhizobium liaoningense]